MPEPPEDGAREWRIENEIVVDAYNEEERAMGWYYHLEGKLQFPFRTRAIEKRRISPLEVGEEVEVTGMPPEEEEISPQMPVLVRWCGRELGVPLAQLEAIDADPETKEAIADWRYWVARGYRF